MIERSERDASPESDQTRRFAALQARFPLSKSLRELACKQRSDGEIWTGARQPRSRWLGYHR
jgi:hypothetical protein